MAVMDRKLAALQEMATRGATEAERGAAQKQLERRMRDYDARVKAAVEAELRRQRAEQSARQAVNMAQTVRAPGPEQDNREWGSADWTALFWIGLLCLIIYALAKTNN